MKSYSIIYLMQISYTIHNYLNQLLIFLKPAIKSYSFIIIIIIIITKFRIEFNKDLLFNKTARHHLFHK